MSTGLDQDYNELLWIWTGSGLSIASIL